MNNMKPIKTLIILTFLIGFSQCGNRKPVLDTQLPWIFKPFIVITDDSNYNNGYCGINVYQYRDSTLRNPIQKKISFAPYNVSFPGGKYSSAGAFYPVQFNSDLSKFYFSIYKGSLEDDEFDWDKLIEYDSKTDSLREIASFSKFFTSWYYSDQNNRIYGFDISSKSFISIELKSLTIDTLYKSESDFKEIDYQQKGNSTLEIITFNGKSVSKLIVDLNSNKVREENIFQMDSFSSYRNGQVVEMFKDFKVGTEEIRLYTVNGVKVCPVDFKNFSTYWINDKEFMVISTDKLIKYSNDLKPISECPMKGVHIIDCLDNTLVISFYVNETEKVGLLSFDLKKLKILEGIQANNILTIRNINN